MSDRARKKTGRLWAVLGANLALVGALAAVGFAAHSLGVFAEGADYLADAAGIGVSILAVHLEARPRTARRPDGYPRATRYAAGLNATWLLTMTLLVAGGAIDRLATGPGHVHGLAVLVMSAVAAIVMGAGALVLGGDPDDDYRPDRDGPDGDSRAGQNPGTALNMKAVLIDTVADGAAAAGVAVAGGVIYATGGNYWLDPAVALAIAVAVAFQALRLIGKVRAALGAPAASVG